MRIRGHPDQKAFQAPVYDARQDPKEDQNENGDDQVRQHRKEALEPTLQFLDQRLNGLRDIHRTLPWTVCRKLGI